MEIELGTIDAHLNSLYIIGFKYAAFILAIFTSISLSFQRENRPQIKTKGNLLVLGLSVLIVLYFGLATIYGIFIGDTILYEWDYRHLDQNSSFIPAFQEKEFLFHNLKILIYKLGGDSYFYFATLIASIYVITVYFTCKKLMKDRIWVAFLFFVVSFSFLGYGTNGIRNGAACHLMMLGIVFLTDRKKYGYFIFLLFSVVAYYIHSSSILPAICAILAVFIIKTPKQAIFIWVLSIAISLIVGNAIGEYFASLGFDDRTAYFEDVSGSIRADEFSSTGFRFDFLFYSFAPVLFIWYLTCKRNFNDNVYNILANTYILANAFWIMVIRATYSNRFAYLSWFLYPLVIAYPLLRMSIWEDQDRKTAIILFAYSSFTIIMLLLGR